MIAAGFHSWFPMERLSVMGLVEVLPKYRHLKRRIAETAAAAVRIAPDALVTIDTDLAQRASGIVPLASPLDLSTG